jgi:hypothetical protein
VVRDGQYQLQAVGGHPRSATGAWRQCVRRGFEPGMMTEVPHILPCAILAAPLTGGLEIAVLRALRNRSEATNIAALVTIPSSPC